MIIAQMARVSSLPVLALSPPTLAHPVVAEVGL